MEHRPGDIVSTEPYKGVRDFYPPDMFIQNYIFDTMRRVVESYGYVEYSASILEPADLYKAKSGEEIVNEQTYSFQDRGAREVTLRPEMTPTVARMVARNRRELALPLRWYSIPNLFRYEAPQRGRLREHWQLNVDMFGVRSTEADIEVITVADRLMKKFGAAADSFSILVNNRRLIQAIYDYFELSETESHEISKTIDKKEKIHRGDFEQKVSAILGNESAEFLKILSARTIDELADSLPAELKDHQSLTELKELLAALAERGVANVHFSPTLMRGFDYYTGIIFEVFDTDPRNRRSLFGGGRYDDLLDIFGAEKITAVGFGMGDVTIRDFLETHALIPPYASKIDIALLRAAGAGMAEISRVADTLRADGLAVAVDLSGKKVGDQIKAADRERIPFILVIGEEEIKTGRYKLKELSSGAETSGTLATIVETARGRKRP